jgi:hypothetical protein
MYARGVASHRSLLVARVCLLRVDRRSWLQARGRQLAANCDINKYPWEIREPQDE